MSRKIGAITIGQSPRKDVIPEMQSILGNNIQIIEEGALNGLTKGEIESFIPKQDDYLLVSKLRDGNFVKFGESYILPRLQKCIERLEHEGVDIIVFICTGTFPDIFKSNVLLLYPQTILHSVVPKLATKGKIGIITPDIDQINQSVEKWSESSMKIEIAVGSPYRNFEEVRNAAIDLKNKDVDVIVMDCIGYNAHMKRTVAEITGKPVILARTLIARIIREMFD